MGSRILNPIREVGDAPERGLEGNTNANRTTATTLIFLIFYSKEAEFSVHFVFEQDCKKTFSVWFT